MAGYSQQLGERPNLPALGEIKNMELQQKIMSDITVHMKYEKYKPKEHPKKKNAKICVFHGHPNPDYAMQYESGEWIKDIWR